MVVVGNVRKMNVARGAVFVCAGLLGVGRELFLGLAFYI